MSIQDIKNLVKISETVSTAGQPTEDQLRALRLAGYHAVINLGLMDARYCLADEAGLVQTLGMDYHHLPVEFSAPRHEQLMAFFALMDRYAGQKLMVHCAANYRVSCFVALYAQARWNWSHDRAEALISQTWTPDPTWRAFMEQAVTNQNDFAAAGAYI